jgi:hypothetical protein
MRPVSGGGQRINPLSESTSKQIKFTGVYKNPLKSDEKDKNILKKSV